MSFRYFAYGSNLWVPQMRSRCPSARPVGTGVIEGWRLVYDKPSTDGSAKLNIRPASDGSVHGVVYEVDDDERSLLDAAEPRYTPIHVYVDGDSALTYTYDEEPSESRPFDWYVALALAGAASHGLPKDALDIAVDPDPLAPGVRPALDDLDLVQGILSNGLKADTDRYYIHPGDIAWWLHHDDPRYPDHLSMWIQGDSGVVVVDSRPPGEISVFTRTGVDRMPLVLWAQRRLNDQGEVGWVDDADEELVNGLIDEGYEPIHTNRSYRWDLTDDLPQPDIAEEWELRPVAGEAEANARRRASHAAFESSMPEAMHLQRYLDFMRSPVYVPERDLVAVDPAGRVGSFIVWWADASGVAQIEPFGTHPKHHRQGIGRALIYHSLREMKTAGMHTCRVITDEPRKRAVAFYEGVGFEDAGRVRWWRKK